MKKTVKIVAVFLTMCIIIAVSSVCVSAYSDDITGTVNYNGESRLNNYGFIWQNKSTVVNNREGATIHNNQPKAIITNNYGRVGSDTVSSRVYGEAGNEGTIDRNYGTVSNNFSGAILTYNYGSITGYNFGFLYSNKEGSSLYCNSGTLGYNDGTIEYNSIGGTIYGNSGLISEANTGTVKINEGTIQRNGAASASAFDRGKVEENYGTIIKNAYNSQVDRNEGTITDNIGYVRNYVGGNVTNNTWEGVVYNYGGTVQNNSGEHYIQVDLSTEHATVSYGEGFSSDNDIDCWLLEGASGTATIEPDEEYEIKSISAENGITAAVKNADGSWSVTVGGLSSNVSAGDLGINVEPLPDYYTVNIDLAGHGEDITVEAPRGARVFDALDNAGVFETLDAMETEDFIFRDLATKPLTEFANEEEYGDDAYELLQKAVDSDMTVYAGFYTKIRKVTLTLGQPIAGTTVSLENDIQTPAPVLTVEEDSHCSVHSDPEHQYSQWYTKSNDETTVFEGVFEKGETYYADCLLNPDFCYWLDEDTEVTANGATVDEAYGRMSLSVSLSAQAVSPAILGDVDGDGDVTICDATFIQRAVTSVPLPFVLNESAADTDGDGEVTIVDATYIQRWLAGLKTNENIGRPIFAADRPNSPDSGDEEFPYLINKPVCPLCGSEDVAYIIYGYPMPEEAYSEAFREKLENHEITFGGCVIEPDCPDWFCNTCQQGFVNRD